MGHRPAAAGWLAFELVVIFRQVVKTEVALPTRPTTAKLWGRALMPFASLVLYFSLIIEADRTPTCQAAASLGDACHLTD